MARIRNFRKGDNSMVMIIDVVNYLYGYDTEFCIITFDWSDVNGCVSSAILSRHATKLTRMYVEK